jgi:hypothetical protein
MHTNGSASLQRDYDLHGLAGIRLIDASLSDAAAVTRQIGPLPTSLTRDPDIIIKFVDQLPTSSHVRYLGLDDAGFTDDAFLVLRGKHGTRARAQIRFEQIGKGCEIVCERGLSAVPLLIPILNLTVLNRGAIPLHASAFTYKGTGVVVTGWAKGGKTETLLAFMARGAVYVGDEWVYISGDGQRMYGIPQPIRIWDWHLGNLPQYRETVDRSDLMRWRAIHMVLTMKELIQRSAHKKDSNGSILNRAIPIMKRQLGVDVPPERLFNGSVGNLSGQFDRLIFVTSHESDGVTVQPIDPLEVARRMVFSLQYERLDFMSFYQKFRFAFPAAANELIEKAEDLQREMLTRVLTNKKSYAVFHPYPVSIPALFDAISPLVNG